MFGCAEKLNGGDGFHGQKSPADCRPQPWSLGGINSPIAPDTTRKSSKTPRKNDLGLTEHVGIMTVV